MDTKTHGGLLPPSPAGAGNVRTATLRAFDEAEFGAILGKLG